MKVFITSIARFFIVGAFTAATFTGCKTETTIKTETGDSLIQSTLADTPLVRNPMETAPSVTTLPPATDSLGVITEATFIDSSYTSSSVGSIGGLTRPSAPIHFKYIAKTETAVPRLNFFVIAADRVDSTVTLQCVIMNRVAQTESEEEKADDRISVTISKNQFAKASLLNNQTGDRRHAEPKANIQKSVSWTLDQADTKSFSLTFTGIPPLTKSVTLIIPDFVTVPLITLPPL